MKRWTPVCFCKPDCTWEAYPWGWRTAVPWCGQHGWGCGVGRTREMWSPVWCILVAFVSICVPNWCFILAFRVGCVGYEPSPFTVPVSIQLRYLITEKVRYGLCPLFKKSGKWLQYTVEVTLKKQQCANDWVWKGRVVVYSGHSVSTGWINIEHSF